MVKNPPANARDTRDAGSVPGSGRSPGGGHGSPSGALAWGVPRTEGPGEQHREPVLRALWRPKREGSSRKRSCVITCN